MQLVRRRQRPSRLYQNELPPDRHTRVTELAQAQLDLNERRRCEIVKQRCTPLQGGPAHEEAGSGRLRIELEPERRVDVIVRSSGLGLHRDETLAAGG